MFLRRQPCFVPRGEAPVSHKWLRPHTCPHTIWETNNQILHGITLDVRQIFTRSTTNADARSVCGSYKLLIKMAVIHRCESSKFDILVTWSVFACDSASSRAGQRGKSPVKFSHKKIRCGTSAGKWYVWHVGKYDIWTSCVGRRHNMPHVTLTFDLLTLKVVSESRVTWATYVPILVFLGLSVT